MIKTYEKFGGIVISGVRIEDKNSLNRYGIADIDLVEKGVYRIKSIVEKPAPDKAPSNLATHGAYILPPDVFGALKTTTPGKGGKKFGLSMQ
jgi:UTP--glucose-1-phosphate uridylyltransferase